MASPERDRVPPEAARSRVVARRPPTTPAWPIGNRALSALIARHRLMSRAPAAPAAGAKAGKAGGRPSSGGIWAAYDLVSYDKMKQDDVWEYIGGVVGSMFDGQNSCAARVSYALNYGGAPISSGIFFDNGKKTVHKGKPGDGMKYIVGSPAMQAYLTAKWSDPDARLKTEADVESFEKSLRAGQIAIFSGVHHSGVIAPGYRDPHVGHPSVMPVDAWKLQ
jgi:hypothetical protein